MRGLITARQRDAVNILVHCLLLTVSSPAERCPIGIARGRGPSCINKRIAGGRPQKVLDQRRLPEADTTGSPSLGALLRASPGMTPLFWWAVGRAAEGNKSGHDDFFEAIK